VTAVLGVLTLVIALSPPGARLLGWDLPWTSPNADCSTNPVSVQLAVHPEVADLVTSVVAPAQSATLPSGDCLSVDVLAQDPVTVVSSSALLPPGRAPHLWIPDSSVWASSSTLWPLESAGSLGFTPVVVATGPAARESLGWRQEVPSWEQALTGTHPVAIPDIRTSGAAQTAYLALWESLGGDVEAERTVAATILDSARTDDAATQAVRDDDPDAPILVTTEADVLAANQDQDTPRLIATYPSGATAALDHPLLRVAPQARSATVNSAVDIVLRYLTSPEAAEAAGAVGLRDATGTGPQGPGIDNRSRERPDTDIDTTAATFLSDLRQWQTPNQVLTVMDVSWSMRSAVPDTGLSRIEFASRAALTTGEYLSDSSSAGLWIFARNLDDDQPYRELSPMAPLDSTTDGQRHRDRLNTDLAALSEHLHGGGTDLYATAVAAMTEMNSYYRVNAINSVVLFTDGTNENDSGLTLEESVDTLTELYDPRRPVRLIAIGIGPDADLESLRALSAPSGGSAYLASDPEELREIVLSSLTNRS
jgi:hypothetical protein